jgi:hypothetical protein
MRFSTDDANLSITCELDEEPGAIDLAGDDRLGDQILDFAAGELMTGAYAQRDPDGNPWEPLASETYRAKGHDRIGIKSGDMLSPANFTDGPRDVTARSATWTFGDRSPKALAFHQGRANVQPARPIVGWTDRARAQAREIIAEAIHRADDGPAFGQVEALFRPVDDGWGDLA